MSNQLTSSEGGQMARRVNGSVADVLKNKDEKAKLVKALAGTCDPEKWIGMAIAAVKAPSIADCTPNSLLVAVHNAAKLGLCIADPRGHAHIVPFKDNNRGCRVAQLIIGWQGYIELAMRSGKVESINAGTVHENDHFAFDHGRGIIEHHYDLVKPRGEIVGSWAKATYFGSSSPVFVVLTRDDLSKRRKDNDVWNTWTAEMCRKSAVRALSGFLPMTPQLRDAIQIDHQADDLFDHAGTPRALEANPDAPKRTRTEQLASRLVGGDPAAGDTPPPGRATTPDRREAEQEPDRGVARNTGDPNVITEDDIPF